MEIFMYGEMEINYLKKKDKKLSIAIDRIGKIEREVTPDLFTALVSSIVSQQISNKAAATVWGRLCSLVGEVTPKSIVEADINDIQKCGMSVRKASYIKNIGEKVYGGELNVDEFHNLSDDEIIKELSALHGIGIWTAEMLMIFSMQRPNVVSWGDLAIRRGMCNLYHHKELTKTQFERYKKRYSPYGSVASLYLWALSVES
ncbi:3-methyladenine DNA glycosylase/8-oxoguanine DNA glycosylase [Sedimentibacter acidaminivorans]|uniref:DNA-3-methyladenine glycosylase II n=1 Tax=Sedimentibacter acidaminivorans TaxID=913099 RepID=A0ABS4GHK9_9FIRM|nr:3-methyladenine DNA glycosylase/8-oxoguanine DNA glycosylase [Sedimentibacter acidaminivorans]